MNDFEELIDDFYNGNNSEGTMCPTCLSKEQFFFKLNNVQKEVLIALGIFEQIHGLQRLCWDCYTMVKNIHKFKALACLAQKVIMQQNQALLKKRSSLKSMGTVKEDATSCCIEENNMNTTKLVSQSSNKLKNNNTLTLSQIIVGTNDDTVSRNNVKRKPTKEVNINPVNVDSQANKTEYPDIAKTPFNDQKSAKIPFKGTLKQLKNNHNAPKLGLKIVSGINKQPDNIVSSNDETRKPSKEMFSKAVVAQSQVNDSECLDALKISNNLKYAKLVFRGTFKQLKNKKNTPKIALKVVDCTKDQPDNTVLINDETSKSTNEIDNESVDDAEYLDVPLEPDVFTEVDKMPKKKTNSTIQSKPNSKTLKSDKFVILKTLPQHNRNTFKSGLKTVKGVKFKHANKYFINNGETREPTKEMNIETVDVQKKINRTQRTLKRLTKNRNTPKLLFKTFRNTLKISHNSFLINDETRNLTKEMNSEVLHVSPDINDAKYLDVPKISSNDLKSTNQEVEVQSKVNDVVHVDLAETAFDDFESLNNNMSIKHSDTIINGVCNIDITEDEPFSNSAVTDKSIGTVDNSEATACYREPTSNVTANVTEVAINDAENTNSKSIACPHNELEVHNENVSRNDSEKIVYDVMKIVDPLSYSSVTDTSEATVEKSNTTPNVIGVSINDVENESIAISENSNAVTINGMENVNIALKENTNAVTINNVENESIAITENTNIVAAHVMGLAIDLNKNDEKIVYECMKRNQSVDLVQTSDSTKLRIGNEKISKCTILELNCNDLRVPKRTELINNQNTNTVDKYMTLTNLSQLCLEVLVKCMVNFPPENDKGLDIISVDTINNDTVNEKNQNTDVNNGISIQMTDIDTVRNAKDNHSKTQTEAYDDLLSPSLLLCDEVFDSSEIDENCALTQTNEKIIKELEIVERIDDSFYQYDLVEPSTAALFLTDNVIENPVEVLRGKTELLVNRITDDYRINSVPLEVNTIIDNCPLNLNSNNAILKLNDKGNKHETTLSEKKAHEKKKKRKSHSRIDKAKTQLNLILLKSIYSDHGYFKGNFAMYKEICKILRLYSNNCSSRKNKLHINECNVTATEINDDINRRNDNDRQLNEDGINIRHSQVASSSILKRVQNITDDSESQINNNSISINVNIENSQNSSCDVNLTTEVKVEYCDPNYDDEFPENNYQTDSTLTACNTESEEISVKQEYLPEDSFATDTASECSNYEPAFNYYNNVQTNTSLSSLSYYDYLYRPVDSGKNSPRRENYQIDFVNLVDGDNDETNKIIVCFSDPIFSTDHLESDEQTHDLNTDSRTNTRSVTNTPDLLEPLYYTDVVETYVNRQIQPIAKINNAFTDNNAEFDSNNIEG